MSETDLNIQRSRIDYDNLKGGDIVLYGIYPQIRTDSDTTIPSHSVIEENYAIITNNDDNDEKEEEEEAIELGTGISLTISANKK